MTYRDFWPRYLVAHSDPRSRGLHYTGTALAALTVAVAGIKRDWRWLWVAPIAGYAPAWLGHLVFERNRPETFRHPAWSLVSDFRMLGMFLSGRIADELRSVGGAEPGAKSETAK